MLANQIAGLGAKMAHINLGLVIGGLGYDVTQIKVTQVSQNASFNVTPTHYK